MLRARSSVSAGHSSRVPATHTQLAQKNVRTLKSIGFNKQTLLTHRFFHNTRRLFDDESSKTHLNDTVKTTSSDAPKILAEAQSEERSHRQQATRQQLRLKASLLLIASLLSLITAGYLLYNQVNEDDDDNEEEVSMGNQLTNMGNAVKSSSASLEDKASSVFQTIVQTVKESVQVQAEEDPLDQAAASMPGQSISNEDVQELQDSLLESQREVSELRQHVRRLQTQLIEQRNEAAEDAESRLREQTEKHLQELDNALERKEQEHRRTLEDIQDRQRRQTDEEVSRRVTEKEDELMEFFAKKGKDRMQKIEELSQVVDAVEHAWNTQADYLEQTFTVHQLEAAVNSLEAISKKPGAPFKPQLSKLAELSKEDAVVDSILDTFGASLPDTGAPSLHDLRSEFGNTARDVKGAVYAPADTGFMGNLFGKAASYLTVPEKGLVDGDEPNAVLARAEFFMEHDNLSQAVREMDRLEGTAASASEPWVSRAKQRLILEQNVKFLQAHTHDLQSSLGQ